MLGTLTGTVTIFVFRKFADSVGRIEHLIVSDDAQKVKDRLLGWLTNRVYWISVAFWVTYVFLDSPRTMSWWGSYNELGLVTAYAIIETLPASVFGGIFIYMIPIGLTMAYRGLCVETPFKEEGLASEWIKPFNDFRRLITLTMLGAAVVAVFPATLWGTIFIQTGTPDWGLLPTDASIVILLASTIVFPHYYFHSLFSRTKDSILVDFQRELSQTPSETDKDISKRILLLLEKGEAEKLETWLIDVKVLGEILVVVLMEMILAEALTTFIHV